LQGRQTLNAQVYFGLREIGLFNYDDLVEVDPVPKRLKPIFLSGLPQG
jgi:hypothetical protein